RPRLNFHFRIMALTRDDVKKIAALARLRFTPEEESRLTRQLGVIVDYIDQLQGFAGVARLAGEMPEAGEGPGSEAEDRTGPSLPRERFLANAPRTLDGFLVVPEIKVGRD